MRRFSLALASACVLALAVTTSAGAIVGGWPDGGRHPYVASLVLHTADGRYAPFCTGTLLAPRVVETAAHCFAILPGATGTAADWSVVLAPSVTFGADGAPLGAIPVASYAVHPDFRFGTEDYHDMAVVRLGRPVAIAPARLAAVGTLDAMQGSGVLRDAVFTEVGFGTALESGEPFPCLVGECGTRRAGTSAFQALTSAWLKLRPAPSLGSYGDSGGPFLVGTDTRTVAATLYGATAAQEYAYRLDTAEAHAFIDPFLR